MPAGRVSPAASTLVVPWLALAMRRRRREWLRDTHPSCDDRRRRGAQTVARHPRERSRGMLARRCAAAPGGFCSSVASPSPNSRSNTSRGFTVTGSATVGLRQERVFVYVQL